MKKNIFILISILLQYSISIAQIQEVTPPTTNALYSGCGYRVSPYNGIWVCGASGTVFRGVFGYLSISWINSSGNLPTGLSMVTVSAVDSANAIAGGNTSAGSFIFRTTNGGVNWTQTFNESNGRINAVSMRNSLTGFAAGNPVGGRWSIWRTTNGGTSWDSAGRYINAAAGETGFNNSLWCIGDTILFGTNSIKIYRSTNYGTNWAVLQTNPDTVISAIYWDYLGLQILSAGGTNTLLKTTDYGSNWNSLTGLPGAGNVTGICSTTPGVYDLSDYFLSVTKGNKIYQGTYSGVNWSTFYTAPTGNFTYIFQKRNEPPPSDQVLIPMVALRDNGGVSICFGCRWGGISKISNEIPQSFSISQNYPNPFNPSTEIKFQLPSAGFVKLVVYDALGSEVSVLVNESLRPGTYEAEWDASDYPSGVYFYQLTVSNEQLTRYTETKKMVLIK